VHSEILIHAPAERAYQLAKDVEGLVEFLPNVKQITIQSRDGGRTVSEWVGLVPEFRRAIRWVEEDVWDDGGLRCDFRSISGDWDLYQGSWTFERQGADCLAHLQIAYEYNVPLIGPLIKKLLHKLVARNVDETLAALRQRTEGAV
jgi:ribosome-associated toxin RatA of RatAB toxin-antitoxin module